MYIVVHSIQIQNVYCSLYYTNTNVLQTAREQYKSEIQFLVHILIPTFQTWVDGLIQKFQPISN